MTPDSAVTCDPELVVDGRTFENADSYPAAFTGKITLTEAIAHSCNTAFISEYQKLSQDQLADAAGALGVGMTANPGIEAFLGTVPREDSEGPAHAASMIGQSRVQTSPLSLATLMAAVVKGGTVVPTLVDGHDPEAKLPDVPKLTEKEAKQLRTMMRSAVVDGYLANLADLPGKPAIGKTGTAEYGSGSATDPLLGDRRPRRPGHCGVRGGRQAGRRDGRPAGRGLPGSRCPLGRPPAVPPPCGSAYQRWATSTTSRDVLPGPSRVKTLNGSRARTPRPMVV